MPPFIISPTELSQITQAVRQAVLMREQNFAFDPW